MKNIIIKLLILSFFFNSCGSLFPKKDSPEKLRKEALEFSLEFVKDLFAKDCEKVYSKFSEKVISMGDGVIHEIKDVKENMCVALDDANRNKDKKYSNYLVDCKTEILSPAEVKKK